jgi:2,4-dienoyl-CoA reductase-like NADH-dependent reductase (Old Yellow Enzyme family)
MLHGATPFPTLLSPVALGPVTVRNRVVSTSHQTSLVHDHLPTEDLAAYHGARAAGGVGAIFIEAAAVHPTGLLTPHTLGGYLPEIVGGYERLAGAVQPHGTRLLVQLFHGGREQFGDAPRAPAVAPSAVPSPRFKSEPRALTRVEIAEIVRGFATAATHARTGGLDGVEVSMAHGYLAPQFFSARTNRRDDEYGGAAEARMRFAFEVLHAIRDAVGRDIAVGVRLSADEIAPDGDGPAACAVIGERLSSGGLVDFVSMAMGHSASYVGSTFIAPPPPVPEDAIVASLPEPSGGPMPVPLIATTRIVDLDHAEAIVAEGRAQLVGMTRAMIAEPELVAKGAAGHADAVPCIGCNQACIGHYHAGLPIACVVNPRTGRERRYGPAPGRAAASLRVLVIGGGPAGIAAAIEAGRAGHAVTLVEREAWIGGQLAIAGRAPGHAELWRRYRAMASRDLRSAGVATRLGTVADAAMAAQYDHVIVASGAAPYVPALVPLPGVATVSAWEAIAAPGELAGPVLVADWGGEWSGLDAAELIAGAGHAVTLACAATHPGETLHQYQRNGYLDRLDRAGVAIRHHLELAVVDGATTLRHVFSGRLEPLGDVATLVLAQGRAPRDELWTALEGRPGVVRVGDALGARTAEEAILEGWLAGRAVGRDDDGAAAGAVVPALAPADVS